MQALNVVLKFTERCNLNCSYCYYFNGLDQSFKERPALLSQSVATNVVHFLEDGVDEMAIKKLSISIHGGEPLLMPKNNFISICKLLTSLSTKVDDFSLHLQTNGTLLDKEWIDIFREFKIKIGLSLDGPQEYHDKYRVYHSGHGSYNKTEKAIRLLQKEQYDFGILSVINPTNDPKTIYNHFIKFLGVKGIDFLWPDFTNDRPPPHTAIKYGEFISKIFEIWTSQDDNTVHIRFLNSYLNLFLGSASLIYGVGADTNKSLHLITIRGDGELSTSDELMSTDPDTVTRMNKKVNEIRLKQFFAAPIFTELDQAFINTPNECKSCCWERICGGGSITNRFNKAKRFNNPSVYCDGLKLFLAIFSNILCALEYHLPMLKQDYYMKKLCKILSLLTLCLAFTSKVKAQEDIFYKFDVKKNHIKVNCIIQGSVSGLTHLKIPVFFDLDRSQLEKLQIYIDGLKYKYTIGNNLITLKHKPLALLQISYQLHNIKGYDSNLYFYITPKFFFFPLQYCLFKTVSSLYKPYNISFHFNTYNGKLFSNTLPSINNPFEGSFTTTQELEGLFFIGGEVSRYEVNNSRSIVFFSNEIKLNKQQIVEYISQIEAIHNNFFEKTNKNSHFIFLLNPKYKYDIEGSNVSNLETIALGTEVKFNYELKRVIAHENLHKWFNSKIFGQYLDEQGYNCWFIEGFTDYYTNYLNSKHNIITLNDYLNSYNKILANYYTSPFRYMTNSNISEVIHDNDIFAIAYWRGMIIAHELNFLIQNSTKYNNKLSLDEYIKYLIRLSGSSYTHFDLNILAKTLFDFTGHDFSNYIDNIKRTNILVNAQYILDNKAFLLLKETEEIIYDFDIAQSQLKWIVQGVNSDSKSFQNGLRNKQKILNITTNSSGHLFFKVKDQNGTKTVKIPQKIKKVLIPQYKLIN